MTEANTGRRLAVIGIVVAALFGGLLTRLWFLQVAGGQQLAVQAQQNRDRLVTVPPLRGTIYDRNGVVLAETVPVTTLTVDRQNLTPYDRLLLEDNLGKLLAITPGSVDKLIDNTKYAPYVAAPVATDVSLDKAIYVAEHRDLFPHVNVTRSAVRRYPQGTLAASVLGYTGLVNSSDLAQHAGEGYTQADVIGKTGTELTFESELRGVPGVDKVQVDSRGRAVDTVEVKKAQSGHDVQLTIDTNVQKIAEESLQQGMMGARSLVDPDSGNYYKANAGAVVVLNARTGEVVALASAPTFNPNDFISGNADQYFTDPDHPLIDRALNPYAPGSTFKMISAVAGLESGVITPDTSVDDEGCIKLGAQNFCNSRKAPNGYVSLRHAITVSSDVYFYSLGNDVWRVYYGTPPGTPNGEGGDKATQHPVGYAIQNTARAFGFDEPTGIALPGDANGRIPDLAFNQALNKNSTDPFSRTWRRGDSANLAVGQGDVLVTPLQLADAYATFANGGTLYTPRIASAVRASAAGLPSGQLGAVVHPIDALIKRTTGLPAAVRGPILDGLDGVTNSSDGTAYGSFRDYSAVHVVGKTGTAQVSNGQDTSWFVGVTNPENDPAVPQYVVVSMVEQGGFGANVSAPIVRRVIESLYGNPAPAPVQVAPATGNQQSF